MVDANGYRVDPEEVAIIVRTMDAQIDQFNSLSTRLGQCTPPVTAFGGVGAPAASAATAALQLLQQANKALAMVLSQFTQNVQTAMNNYQQTDGSGASAIVVVTGNLSTPAILQRLLAGGLGAGAIHTYLQNQSNQVGAGIAEVYVGGDLTDIRVRPGDLVTTADLTATVGPDGRLYSGGQPVQAPTGAEARVYRTMSTGPSTIEA
jgi:uncharacterized protein YukE